MTAFETILEEGTSSRTLATDVTKAVRSSLIMRPIYELPARIYRQVGLDNEPNLLEHVDLMWLAFATLDIIAELTEYQVGASRTEILQHLFPLAEAQLQAQQIQAQPHALEHLLGKVFDHLVNRDNRYLPFSYRFYDGAQHQFHTRKFWLIKAVYTGQGKESFFALTDEGYVAYFGLHESSALDAAAIGNLRIKLLIERGKVDDALTATEQNRKQCLRKANEVRDVRRSIERNIQAVDFRHIHQLADEGADQATQIQQESGRLHHLVLDNLDKNSDEEELRYKLQQLAENLEQLNIQQMKLVNQLQKLPDDFSDHSHKLFRRRSIGIMPAMDTITRRLFATPEAQAAAVGVEFIARFDPPLRQPLFDPGSMIDAIDRALERQNASGDIYQQVEEAAAELIEYFQPELNDALMGEALKLLFNTVAGEPVLLSQLLTQAAAPPTPLTDELQSLLPIAMAMQVFQCVVDHRLAEKYHLQIEPQADQHVRLLLPDGRLYRGHELLLSSTHPSSLAIATDQA
ncbi:hypothetical protein [Spartinivicinus poritis]|uniref:Uncharacterized protein n=1 Tax=Spartinivicinus poritis TaxID=2994640 RepID=A0ABT5U5K3_9GAMM|nr:hypothetical protein [Spartinivicinus sp. A2-2]MDE1460842.1 hypothetical protein [Spartinivicinus sp. A2-2]